MVSMEVVGRIAVHSVPCGGAHHSVLGAAGVGFAHHSALVGGGTYLSVPGAGVVVEHITVSLGLGWRVISVLSDISVIFIFSRDT